MTPPADQALVVIPCLNEKAHLEGVLAAMLADPHARHCRIVVCDGGSTDASRDIVARHPQVTLLDNPRRLQSAAVNLAAETFGDGCAWLIRVDAHADYPPAFLGRLIETAKATGAQSVVTSMTSRGVDCFQRAVAAAQNSKLGTGGSAHRSAGAGGWVDHGHHALFDMRAFRAVGGYNAAFTHNEDAELDVRLNASGARIWLAGDLPIGYYPRRTPGALFRQYINHGAGRARTVMLHRTRLKLRQWAPAMIAPAALAALLAPWFWPVALPAALWAGASLGYGLLLGLKARDPCACMAGVPAMIAHLGWSIGFWRQRLFGSASAP